MILEGVRLADCKLLRCGRERDDTRQLCPECEQRLLADLEWFMKNIGYLETDKMNRINKNHDADGGGGGYSDNPPLREQVFDLLYEGDEHMDSVWGTLSAFAKCLGVEYLNHDPLNVLAQRIAVKKNKQGEPACLCSTATPVYALEIRIARDKCQRLLNQGHTVSLGNCPNTDCNMPLSADETAKQVKCRGCRNVWNINFLRTLMQDKIKHSTYTGTASDIRSKLQQAGYLVSANTLKSWAHRGKLTPVRKEGRHPIYRIADVYMLMRVLQVESPELFDGSDDQPVRVVGYDYSPFCEAVCETCGDDPEMLTIGFETKNGERYSQYYDYFGLPNILEALGKWDKQYGMDNETTGR